MMILDSESEDDSCHTPQSPCPITASDTSNKIIDVYMMVEDDEGIVKEPITNENENQYPEYETSCSPISNVSELANSSQCIKDYSPKTSSVSSDNQLKKPDQEKLSKELSLEKTDKQSIWSDRRAQLILESRMRKLSRRKLKTMSEKQGKPRKSRISLKLKVDKKKKKKRVIVDSNTMLEISLNGFNWLAKKLEKSFKIDSDSSSQIEQSKQIRPQLNENDKIKLSSAPNNATSKITTVNGKDNQKSSGLPFTDDTNSENLASNSKIVKSSSLNPLSSLAHKKRQKLFNDLVDQKTKGEIKSQKKRSSMHSKKFDENSKVLSDHPNQSPECELISNDGLQLTIDSDPSNITQSDNTASNNLIKTPTDSLINPTLPTISNEKALSEVHTFHDQLVARIEKFLTEEILSTTAKFENQPTKEKQNTIEYRTYKYDSSYSPVDTSKSSHYQKLHHQYKTKREIILCSQKSKEKKSTNKRKISTEIEPPAAEIEEISTLKIDTQKINDIYSNYNHAEVTRQKDNFDKIKLLSQEESCNSKSILFDEAKRRQTHEYLPVKKRRLRKDGIVKDSYLTQKRMLPLANRWNLDAPVIKVNPICFKNTETEKNGQVDLNKHTSECHESAIECCKPIQKMNNIKSLDDSIIVKDISANLTSQTLSTPKELYIDLVDQDSETPDITKQCVSVNNKRKRGRKRKSPSVVKVSQKRKLEKKKGSVLKPIKSGTNGCNCNNNKPQSHHEKIPEFPSTFCVDSERFYGQINPSQFILPPHRKNKDAIYQRKVCTPCISPCCRRQEDPSLKHPGMPIKSTSQVHTFNNVHDPQQQVCLNNTGHMAHFESVSPMMRQPYGLQNSPTVIPVNSTPFQHYQSKLGYFPRQICSSEPNIPISCKPPAYQNISSNVSPYSSTSQPLFQHKPQHFTQPNYNFNCVSDISPSGQSAFRIYEHPRSKTHVIPHMHKPAYGFQQTTPNGFAMKSYNMPSPSPLYSKQSLHNDRSQLDKDTMYSMMALKTQQRLDAGMQSGKCGNYPINPLSNNSVTIQDQHLVKGSPQMKTVSINDIVHHFVAGSSNGSESSVINTAPRHPNESFSKNIPMLPYSSHVKAQNPAIHRSPTLNSGREDYIHKFLGRNEQQHYQQSSSYILNGNPSQSSQPKSHRDIYYTPKEITCDLFNQRSQQYSNHTFL